MDTITRTSPFDSAICRWLLLSLAVLDIAGPRRWSGAFLGTSYSAVSYLTPTNAITAYYVVLGVVLILLVRSMRVDHRFLFGTRPRARDVAAATGVGVTILLLMIWAERWVTPRISFWLADAGTTNEPQHPIATTVGLRWWQNLAVASILTPIIEETLFRGLLYQRVANRFGAWIGIFVSSVVFGVWHDRFLGPFLFGLLLCLLFARTSNLYLCIIAHGIANFLGFASSPSRQKEAIDVTNTALAISTECGSQCFWTLASAIAFVVVLRDYLTPDAVGPLPYIRNQPDVEPSHALEPAAGPDSIGESSPPAQ